MSAASSRVAIALTPRHNDPVQMTRRLAGFYGDAFARLGLMPLYLDLDTAGEAEYAQVFAPEVKVLFSHGGWLFREDGPLGPRGPELIRQSEKPVIVLIADPPHSYWLPPLLAAFSRQTMPFFIDPTFAAGSSHWSPSGCWDAYLPCAWPGHDPAATRDKTIPALFVGSLNDPNAAYEKLKKNAIAFPLINAILERALEDLCCPLIDAITEVFALWGAKPDLTSPYFAVLYRDLLSYIREYHRARMVRHLLHHDVLIVADGLAGLPPRTRAKLHPPVPFPDLLGLLRRSRVLCVAQPPYPGALNERIVYAMQARCLVVTTANLRLPQLFEHGRHLLFTAPDLSDLDEMMARAADDTLADPMRDAALDRIRQRHSAEGNIRYMLRQLWQAGLLDQDLAGDDGPHLALPPLPPR